MTFSFDDICNKCKAISVTMRYKPEWLCYDHFWSLL